MYFEYPDLLWLLVIPVLLVLHYLYLELAGRHPHLRVSTSVPWTLKTSPVMSVMRHVPFALRIFALSMVIVAIARPRSSEQMEKIDTEGIDIVLAMDVSTSMLARDLTPDRINASKDIAIEFVGQDGNRRLCRRELHPVSPYHRPRYLDKSDEGGPDRHHRGRYGHRKRSCDSRGEDEGFRCQEPCGDPSY